MPEKDCVTYGNKVYCWNEITKRIDVYTRKSIPVENCPKEILVQLMQALKTRKEEV